MNDIVGISFCSALSQKHQKCMDNKKQTLIVVLAFIHIYIYIRAPRYTFRLPPEVCFSEFSLLARSAPALLPLQLRFIGFKHALKSFATILENEGFYQSTLASPVQASTSTSTATLGHQQVKQSSDQTAKESSTEASKSSHCRTSSPAGRENEYSSVVLPDMLQEEFLQGGVLRQMWCFMELATTIQQCFILGWTAMVTGSTTDLKEKKFFKSQRKGTWTRRKISSQRQRKSKANRWRLLCPIWVVTMAAILGIANPGSGSPRHDAEDHTNCTYEASRRSHLRLEGPPEDFGSRIMPRSGSIPGQMSWQWSTGHQASQSETGGLGQDGSQTQSRIGAAQGQLAEVSKASRGGVRAAEDEVYGQEEAAIGWSRQSRGGVLAGAGSTTRSSSVWGEAASGNTCSCEDASKSQLRIQDGWHTYKAFIGGTRFGGRPGDQEAAISNSCSGVTLQGTQWDGFLIGRHASCNNGHVRRPRFFCLVEVKTFEETSTPTSIGSVLSSWWDLSAPRTCQTIAPNTPFPDRQHTYGPRQAEYVAQLMRFDVETGRHNEAFDHCMWDDTMTSLSYLDLIERSFRLAPELHGIPWSHIERQVEGSSFWTLMGLEQEDEYPGCIEWTGSIPQGDRLITLSLEDEKRLMESLEKDSLWAFDFLSKQHSLQEKGIEIVTYGHFDQYQGQRTTNIPLHLLKRWKDLVRQQWEDFGHFGPFDYHLVHPHPPDSQFAIHVIVRCRDNPGQQHFLLVDQIDESPLDRNYRSVIAVSHVPNGYEVMLATANDLNTISSRTILKHGTDIWPLHQRLPVRDGQYWRILHENHEETISFIQSAVELDELPRTISSEGSSLCSHVIDRWCGKGNDLRDPSTTDVTGLMQQSLHLQIDNSEALAPSTGIDLGFEIPVNAWSNFCEVCFLSPEEGSWTLMTHGLWEQHLGSRPVEVDEADPQTIKVALRAAWNDVPHPAQLHAVHPNPEDGPFAHIIIEFKTPGPYDDSFVPVLRRIFRNDQVQCEAAYHQPARQAYDIYYQAGLDTTCKPWNHHECRVYVNKVQLRDTLPFTLQPGSLVDIHVEPLPLPGHHVDRALSPDEGSSFCSHVSDRWCSIRDELQDGVETDEAGLMQHPLPSQSDGPIIHDFFHLENEHFHLDISNEDVPNLETIVENDRQLPSIGPNSIRGFHWVANPPRLGRVAPAVYILELRGDAESRLMNDDVLCLCQLTIEQPGPQGDLSTKIRVLWTPHIASRERIMFHLRAADLCREMTCILYVNHIVWNVQDSIIRHFNDGDFIHLRIVVAPGESVAATRCDFQSYESTERHRRVFTNGSSSSQGTETPDATPSDHSIRSRSRGRRSSEPDAEPDLPPPSSPDSPEEAEEEQDEADDQLSLLQLASYPARHTLDTSTLGCTMDFEIQPDLMSAAHSDTVISIQNRRQLDLSELLPATSVISCDLTEVHNAKQLLSQLPWLLSDIGTLAIPSTVLEAMIPVMKPWNFEVPVKYQLYTDGSYYKRKPEVGGCGIVLVVETEYGPLCGGLMSRTCLPTARSHSAEAIAMLWASIIAVQLNELHQRYFPAVAFKLDFCYDAEVTGKQSAGQWTSFRHSGIQQLTRNMIYVLQHRSGPQALDWIHIPAHQGHWWNEVADALAKNAVTHSEVVQNSDLLYSILDAPALMKAFGWIWAYEAMIEQHPSMPCIFDNYMYHFRTPIDSNGTFPCHFGLDDAMPEQTLSVTDTLTMKVATFNVLTLGTNGDHKFGTGSCGRHLSLLQQCHEAGLHIVGVQETRTKKVTCKNNPWYHIIHAPCRSDGHYGIQIWLHRSFAEDDYRIVWSTYNVLAVRLLHPALRCIVIAARAPTSDKSTMELQAFWSDITKQVLQKFPGWKILLLCDSNSHVGSCPSTSISDCGEELENQAGAIFHGWLLANDIWLPSTWQHVQKGDHYTYVTPSGSHHHRLDFVGLSLNWPLEFVATEVNFDIDGSLSRYDHFAATCTMKTATSIASKSGAQQGRKPSLDRAAVMKQLQADPHYFDSLPMIPWSTDVHRHATGLATATLGRLWSTVPCTRRHVRKRQLTDLTWNILMWKRRLRKHHLDASRRRKFGTLREILLAWKGVCASTTSRNVYPSFRWLKFIDVKIALMEHNLHKVQPLLQTMIKQDDIAYYKALALRAGRTETEDGMQALWKELRGTLPKWKTRRTQPRHDIDEALCLHFSSLEAGTITSFNGLYRQCVDYQNQTRHSAPQTLNLDDLPSLFEIEQVCRRTTPTRAPGPDTVTPEVCRHGAAGIASHVHNMVFKICCEQAEPIWFKGGYVHPIYNQKGALDDPAAYRGVVLLDVYGKKFHAWLRQRLVPVLQHRKTAGQLGGLPCEQTLTGSHLLRVHGQVARALRISSAVVFVDVRAAFHHMLRELIFLQGSPALHPEQALDAEHFNMQELQELLLQRCCEHPDDFPAPLRKLADDVHRHTWFTQRGTALQPIEVVHTLRGTRPGSPVADVGFNLLMSDILTDLQQRLDNDETLQAHNADFPVNIPPITWVDDLAIPIHASHPSTLSVVIQAVLQHVHEVFYARGLQINYDKGKTEVVVMFRGSEADEARRQFFSTERETYIVTSTTTHVISVRAVPSYKHLGIRYQMDSDLTHEIQCRSAQARTAYFMKSGDKSLRTRP